MKVDATSRISLLDGLRGAASLAVVYVHCLFLTGIATRAGGGQIGVLVFFVLSGYLITRVLWRARSSPRAFTDYVTFVRRRASRLYPALIGVVFVAGPVMAAVGPESWSEEISAVAMVATQTTAFFQAAGSMPVDGWLHTWSLTVEWTFYVTWPVAVVAARRRQVAPERLRRWTLAAAAALYAASVVLPALAFYVLPVGNLAVMLLGASLALKHVSAEAPPRHDPGLAGIALLLLAVMVFLPSNTSGLYLYRFTYFVGAAAAAYVIIDRTPPGSRVGSLLSSRALTAVGRASYSLYLWHVPVLWVVWWGLPAVDPVQRALVAVAAMFPVVWASYTFLEKPWLRRRMLADAHSASSPAHTEPMPQNALVSGVRQAGS